MAVLFLSLLLIGLLRAEDWPKGFILYDGSVSPDGKRGILIPSAQSMGDSLDDQGMVNYLADIKQYRVLGDIKDSRYWENGNHVWLKVAWSQDSSVCLLEYQARFDTHSVVVLVMELSSASFRQTSIAKSALDALDGAIAEQTKNSDQTGCSNLFCRIDTDRRILVKGLSTTNPKEMEDQPTTYAYFAGVYEIATAKWIQSEAMSLTEDQYDSLTAVLADEVLGGGEIEPAAAYAEELEAELNSVYQGLRFMVSAEKFGEIESGQKAWLKSRGIGSDLSAQNESVIVRIRELKDLAW